MLNQLCEKALEILKQTKTRRSAQAIFDVFYHMWADGSFDGYGLAEKIAEDREQFAEYFVEHGNSQVYDNIKTWYKEKFGARKQTDEPKMITVSVGDLLQESDKAYCFHSGKFTNGRYGLEPVGIWVPKSQVEYNGHNELTMPMWLAVEKNYMRSN
jgi:hypothetical protein